MKKLLLLLLAVAVGSQTLHAHELGKTRATAHFAADGTYTIDIAVDPAALLAKVQILSGQPQATIDTSRDLLLANMHVTFDDVEERPMLTYIADLATIRLAGHVPPAARSVRFAYDLVMGAFPFTVDGRTVWLTGGQASEAFPVGGGPQASRLHVAGQYLVLGFEHIVPKGLDHILFVLGIFLLGTAWRQVLLQVTTFTIAHSITLGLTIYGVVSLPSSIVEPMIALSITYVAIENLFAVTLTPWRVGLVFCFGLLHGMGFAGVLRELGLPRSEFLTALVTFNLGVEAGQLAVIAMATATALLALGWFARWRRPASLLIAAVGAYWTVVRLI
jgi:hypothetical protein